MIERFEGDQGRRRLVATLAEHRLVGNNEKLSERLVSVGELLEGVVGSPFITQGDVTSDVFFIITGSVEVRVNSKVIAHRFSGDHVGEMAAIEPTQPRSATLIPVEPTVLLKITEEKFAKIADEFPVVWKKIASTLARRLMQRNHLITAKRERVKVFIMSSVEALPVVNLIIRHFEHDAFLAVAWQNGVFRASNYTLDELEEQLDDSDFAIAVAHSDDVVISREEHWPAVRDNVIFELGMFMGRLGRQRAFLLEPRDAGLTLPSDLAGMTTVAYRHEPGKNAMDAIAPACARLRELILAAGAKD